MQQTAVLLHNIRSAFNVGSIFRTADAAGVSKIFLSGYSPTPLDRFGRARADIAKVALGGERSVPWEYEKNPFGVIAKLREAGYTIVGVEQDAHAIDYRQFAPEGKTLFILGNEVRGISPVLRKNCDTILEIPMHGTKESLNVAVVAGIILFTCRNYKNFPSSPLI